MAIIALFLFHRLGRGFNLQRCPSQERDDIRHCAFTKRQRWSLAESIDAHPLCRPCRSLARLLLPRCAERISLKCPRNNCNNHSVASGGTGISGLVADASCQHKSQQICIKGLVLEESMYADTSPPPPRLSLQLRAMAWPYYSRPPAQSCGHVDVELSKTF